MLSGESWITRLVEGNGAGCRVEPGDVDAILGALEMLLTGRFRFRPVPDAVLARFERRRLTAGLARVFERVLHARRWRRHATK